MSNRVPHFRTLLTLALQQALEKAQSAYDAVEEAQAAYDAAEAEAWAAYEEALRDEGLVTVRTDDIREALQFQQKDPHLHPALERLRAAVRTHPVEGGR